MANPFVDQFTSAISSELGVSADDARDMLGMLANEHFRESVLACWRIYDKKGNDYTRGLGDLDRTDNFKKAADNNGVSPFQAWGVYFYKHESALWRFLKEGQVESEPIEGRIHDIINYSILLLLLIKEQRANSTGEQE